MTQSTPRERCTHCGMTMVDVAGEAVQSSLVALEVDGDVRLQIKSTERRHGIVFDDETLDEIARATEGQWRHTLRLQGMGMPT